MRRYSFPLAAVLAFLVIALQPVNAQVPIDVSIGTPGGNFAPGSTVGSGTFNCTVGPVTMTCPSGLNQPPPFNAFCGNDLTSNCSASWTFTYIVPSGDTITSASLTLGILDIDSASPGNQVASFTLDGTDDLTGLLNTAAEGLNSGSGAGNNQYDLLTVTIPNSDLADLGSGSAIFALTLQGPVNGPIVGHPQPDNGAGLDFSTLDMEAEGPLTPIPEPSSWMLLLTGLLLVGFRPMLKKLL